MDCRSFRSKHVAYVDDFLSGEEVVAMRQHLFECESCSAHDTKVRRSLLAFRSLPSVEPPADFYARLSARIESERLAPPPAFAARGPGVGTFMSVAAGLVAAGYLAAGSFNWNVRREVALAPVVATQPEVAAPMSFESQAIVTSVSAGMPVWPMMLFAEKAPVRFAQQVRFTEASLRR